MRDTNANVLYNEKIGDDYMRIGLKVGWSAYQPGQFVMMEIPGEAVFLRRPFSIGVLESGELEIVYKIIGKGTGALAGVQKGAALNVLGPLGKGFEVGDDVKDVILVAGGFGFAPLYGLAASLKGRTIRLFYGARSSRDILYLDKFEKMGVDVRLATEDGSVGEKGLVTTLLESYLTSHTTYPIPHTPRHTTYPIPHTPRHIPYTIPHDIPHTPQMIAACGPAGMLKETVRISGNYNIKAQVSLEEYMACGIGVCLGCVTKDRDGHYITTCKDGPVFDAERLEHSNLPLCPPKMDQPLADKGE